ncbi:MAG: PAS domain S-box protein [Proteobacteria bacterium]|nr:PAS domain S-box protein [Pseudomonadota bacterium]
MSGMKLRVILLVLCILVLISTSVGGYMYYSSLKEASVKEAKFNADSKVRTIMSQLSTYLSANLKPVQAMAGLDEMLLALSEPGPESLAGANAILDTFQNALAVDVCYLMDAQGRTIASSNRYDPDSFVGQNFDYRPYFQNAINGFSSTYMAMGATSGVRGAYYSHPVYPKDSGTPLGVAVIKTPIGLIENDFLQGYGGTAALVSPEGVVFGCSNQEWLFKTLHQLNPEERETIRRSRQFGDGPWEWIGLTFDEAEGLATDQQGNRFLASSIELDYYRGWTVLHLRDIAAIPTSVPYATFKATGSIVVGLCFLAGMAVLALYVLASKDIALRRRAEAALVESKERYRALYHNTPAMLHSIDADGRLLSVSDYWCEVMGYSREELIGTDITQLHTEKSRRFAREEAIPGFFRSGFMRDVPYQFVTKDGRVLDVLLTATSERDQDGGIQRSLAVSVDISARKQAEQALLRAKEQLALYSEDLERQVAERTRETASILRHTPAMVYMKDTQGRLSMVNSRYEDLFGVKNGEAVGRRAEDILPETTAALFAEGEAKALKRKGAVQVEERIPLGHVDSERVFLSVKFPILDETGQVERICSIGIDITDLKKTQDKLRSVSGSVLTSQERERATIARRLHDELGQVLTALRMDAVWIKDRLKDADAKLSERAMAMCTLVDSTISDVRSIATRLRPAVLDDLGLLDALEWFTADFEKRTRISCRFVHQGVDEVAETLATTAYRVAQEALTNVARHAAATQVEVKLVQDTTELTLTVTDNGTGFSPHPLEERATLGLAGMQERAGLVGGILTIKSTPGQGTVIRLRLPLQPDTDISREEQA